MKYKITKCITVKWTINAKYLKVISYIEQIKNEAEQLKKKKMKFIDN